MGQGSEEDPKEGSEILGLLPVPEQRGMGAKDVCSRVTDT